jgi:SAM-dependent methyltransferase
MATALLSAFKSAVNKSLAPIGIQISRAGHNWGDVANFIPFEQTMAAARARGMSVGDYVDAVMNGVPGSSQSTIDKMASVGVFSQPLNTIVEIGPGTGRYLEKTLKACKPTRYEIYETAGPWSDYLMKEYQLVLQPTDGYFMSATADHSVDLVHAHKVFSGTPFMVSMCYWQEMVRVLRPGGWAVFDVLTERCLTGDAVSTWIKSGIRNATYPAPVPRETVVSYFAGNGFTLAGSFIVPMPPGTTELLAFRK